MSERMFWSYMVALLLIVNLVFNIYVKDWFFFIVFVFHASIYWWLEELHLKTPDCSLDFHCMRTSVRVCVCDLCEGMLMKEEERADWWCQILLMRQEMSLSQVWTPPPLSSPIPPVMCVDVCARIWTRHWLSPIPSSVSLTGPSRRAASLFPPDGTTAQLTPPQPCQHNPRLRPTICSPDPDERRVGCD